MVGPVQQPSPIPFRRMSKSPPRRQRPGRQGKRLEAFRRQLRVRKTQLWALGEEVAYLNDIQGFADTSNYPYLAAAKAKLIVMHAVQGAGRAQKTDTDPAASWAGSRISSRCASSADQTGIARDGSSSIPAWALRGHQARGVPHGAGRLPSAQIRLGLPLLFRSRANPSCAGWWAYVAENRSGTLRRALRGAARSGYDPDPRAEPFRPLNYWSQIASGRRVTNCYGWFGGRIFHDRVIVRYRRHQGLANKFPMTSEIPLKVHGAGRVFTMAIHPRVVIGKDTRFPAT